MSSCHVLLRAFVCATDQGFAVLPGGLGITAADVKDLIGNTPELQYSKDVWVLSGKPVEPFSLMERFHAGLELEHSIGRNISEKMAEIGFPVDGLPGLVDTLPKELFSTSPDAMLKEANHS